MLFLAPMEGVTDSPMRELYSRHFPITHCVTEFLRITNNIPPRRIFFEHTPELKHDCKTIAGTPVIFQLLGGDPDRLAEAAQRAVQLGATAIDLNFGCPAKTVNKNDGGATLLKYPDRIFQIVKTVRSSLAKNISVSAKVRLGWDSIDPIYKIAETIELAGADWITIHARTRMQAYSPPVYYEPIAIVKKNSKIPVVANGDIWNLDDFKRCRDITGCEHYMLGRSVLANPSLLIHVAKELGIYKTNNVTDSSTKEFTDATSFVSLFDEFAKLSEPVSLGPHYTVKRLKQWAGYIHRRYNLENYDSLVRTNNIEEFLSIFNGKTGSNN